MVMKATGDGIIFPDNTLQGSAASGNNLWINSFGDVKQRGVRDSLGILYDRIIQSAAVTNPAWTADMMFDSCFQLNAAGDYVEQRFERINVRRTWLASKLYTASAYYDCPVAGNVSLIVDYPAAVDYYAAVTSVVVDTFSIPAGTGRIERQVTLPDNAFVYGARVRFQSAGAVLKLNGLRFEPGKVASPLDFWKIGNELAECQRYYQQYSYLYAAVVNNDPTARRIGWPRTTVMRGPPNESGTLQSGGTGTVTFGNYADCISISVDGAAVASGAVFTDYIADAEIRP